MRIIGAGKEIDNSRILEELRAYSITPTTFASREYENEEADNFWCRDTFSYRDNSVVRFAINTHKVNVEEVVERGDEAEAVVLGQKFKVVVFKEEKASVKTVTSKYSKPDAEAITHHDLEKDVFIAAVKHLLTTDQRTVIVDIFARASGAVKIKNGEVEIHSVLLYKNPVSASGKFEVIVIDPSNFIYSSHLSGGDIRAKLAELGLPVEIKTYHKQLQIYKSPDPKKVGFGTELFRDCIDVAVKLAFGFNKLPAGEKIDVEKLGDHEVVVAISNLDALDSDIFKVSFPVRVKQSSDVIVVKAFMAIEKFLTHKLKILSVLRESD